MHVATKSTTVLVFLLLGCQPDIGDPCNLPSDCSLNGDRLCDTTAPGGYCTLFNCEPGGCPEGSICVAYGALISRAPECRSPQASPRFQRTFCMQTCSSSSDCRQSDGYACTEIADVDALSAAIVERGRVSTKVCNVEYNGGDSPDNRAAEVCSGAFDGSFPPPLTPAAADAATDAGMHTDARADVQRADAPSDAPSDGSRADAAEDGSPRDGSVDASEPDARNDTRPPDAALDNLAEANTTTAGDADAD